ncbi:MAG: Dihydroorotate dehydrogenase B (NAD(+)), electron transfer subunit [candidate division BRC1 bacterium ADurb.BinA364]|nr:MAG: Dihydroorotate dehydrogenase B (NAD(+)), electron transfer subunit [candidate division BRC1 bacterium ADurb.BinA364]
MFPILSKREIAPNMHEIVIEAPAVARKAQPGQFCIAMVDDTSERVPYTLAEWDAETGAITLVVQEAGQSSRKLILLEAGDSIAHLAGPLGQPLDVERFGTVALAAGCYGIGAILGIARSMKQAGNRVIALIEARTHYLHYYKDKLKAASDEIVQTTADGSEGIKGHAMDALATRLRAGETIDRVIAVGCPFMMMLTCQETRPFGVKTLVALNPIMLDGTGMCGACRVSVGEQTRFACVDGPFFDGHLVDWEELMDRRAAYSAEEIDAVARTEPVVARNSGGCGCHGH